ncbi:MAG TPA: DUF2807 domain-containing protein [Fimbriimonadaceae bacterium]|nr:DUF2807 domain-containing protein [Fimbriimonadaceae bacterium]
MKVYGILAIIGTAVAAYALASAPEKKVDLAKFDKISAHEITQVIYKPGKTQSVTVSGNDILVKATTLEVKNGQLIIDQDGKALKDVDLPDNAKVVVTITTPSLTAIELSGAATFKGTGIKQSKLQVSGSGAAVITVTGSAKNLDVNLSGASHFVGNEFKSDDCTVSVTGAANAELNVSKNLDATASGVSSVSYKGSPHVTKAVTGLANIGNK